MTAECFYEQMGRLSGLRFRPADLETHWDALQDLPDDVLEAAVSRALKTRAEFPAPVELRQDADLVVRQLRPATREDDAARKTPLAEPRVIRWPDGRELKTISHEWRYDCDVCSDAGWESAWCGDLKDPHRQPWQEIYTCDRRYKHAAHEVLRKCRCWETNQTLVRKREAARKYAESAGKSK